MHNEDFNIFALNWKPLVRAINDINDTLQLERRQPKVYWTLKLNQYNVIKGDLDMVQLTDIQKVTLGPIAVLDARGNPAPIEGVPAWVSGDPTILTVTPSADGLSADVLAVGPLTAPGASVQVVVTADANLDPNVVDTITGSVDFTVVNSEATQFVIPTGTPVNQ